MKKVVYIIIAVLVIVALGVGIYFIVKNNNTDNSGTSDVSNVSTSNKPSEESKKSIKDEIVTKENYEQIQERIKNKELSDDDTLYMSYSMMYYMTKDGMAAALKGEDQEVAMYQRIYYKKVSQLVEEGKQLMTENNITLEQYKEQLANIGNTNGQ